DVVSRPGFSTRGWHTATVPSTVVAALVGEGRFPDPYTAMNLRAMPGTTYPIAANFAKLPMPDDSPYRPAWWYRKDFELTAENRVDQFQRDQLPREHLGQRHADRVEGGRGRTVPAVRVRYHASREDGRERGRHRGVRAGGQRPWNHLGRLESGAARQEHGLVG